MRMISTVCGAVLVAAACSGCLRKEVTQTIYLAPSGTVWSVIEREVRSDAKDPLERVQEEHDYFLAASAGRHPVAEALRRLGARSVTTTWLRRERPFAVMTEARFSDLRELVTSLLRNAGAQGEATLVQKGCETTFGVRVDLASPPAPHADGALDELLTDLYTYRFVLARGWFVSADGFTILDEGTVAVPDARKSASENVLTLGITWVDDECVVK